MSRPQPSWLARQLYKAAVRLYPRYDDPHHNLIPEMLVAFNGHQGAYLLKQFKDQPHISIYWPGRGERYLVGKTLSRVTMTAETLGRLSREEVGTLRSRILTYGHEYPRLLVL